MVLKPSYCSQSDATDSAAGCQCTTFCPGYGRPAEGAKCPPLITVVSLWLETEKYQHEQLGSFRRMVVSSKLLQ